MQDEVGWLIEMKFGNGLLWWSGAFDNNEDRWDPWKAPPGGLRLIARMVNDAGHAVRFARQEDAQRVLSGLLAARPSPLFRNAPELYSVQGHMWPSPDGKPPNAELSGPLGAAEREL